MKLSNIHINDVLGFRTVPNSYMKLEHDFTKHLFENSKLDFEELDRARGRFYKMLKLFNEQEN